MQIILNLILFFPMTIFAHLISITATTPFPSTVSEFSISTATFTVTNISSGVIFIPTNQSQFPSDIVVVSSSLGSQLAPGQSCAITLQLQPLTVQNISTALKVWAKPTLDAVQYPINVTVTPVQTFDAIVIGAGISGLEAATVLQQNNMQVMILEARNRIGGRIETTTMSGVYTDLGATWFHDVDNNVLANLANQFSVPLINTPVASTAFGVYNNGVPLNISSSIYSSYPLLNLALLGRTYANCGSFADAINCFVTNVLPPSPDNVYIAYAQNILLSSWFGTDTTNVSSIVGPSYLNLGHDAIPSIGYTNFLETIFDINSLNINLNSVVSVINYTNDRVIINTADGKAFSAKYVIITVPIGVLQSNSIQFTPSLPSAQQTAIQNLGYGAMNKIFLLFASPFWNQTPPVTFFLPYTANPDINYYMIYNYYQFLNQPILMTFTIGEFAKEQELLTDTQIVNNVMTQIRLIYPSAPDPLQYQVTRWGQDPFSLGAYSYPSINTSYEDIVNLTLPVQNKLFFAGEAVNQMKDGTADAAYTSGLNAANAVLNLLE
jgi:monoamine oxidase